MSKHIGNLGEAIANALKQSGKSVDDIVAPPKPAEQRIVVRGITWEQEVLGELTLSVDGYNTKWQNDSVVAHTYAGLDVKDLPEFINVQIVAKLRPGVRLLHVSNGSNMFDCTKGDVPTFQVPVTWHASGEDEGGPMVPHTRRTDIDNIDLILVDQIGRFIEVQVSITTRKGTFFLNLQEVYAGHIVRTTAAIAKKLGLNYYRINDQSVAIVVPLFVHNAHPGADYLRTWKDIGNQLVKMAIEGGRSVQLSRATYAKWEEPKYPQPTVADKTVGLVTFFNVVIGWGFMRGADGKHYFLHFKDLRQEYVPVPGEFYEFHVGQENGKLRALAAKRIR